MIPPHVVPKHPIDGVFAPLRQWASQVACPTSRKLTGIANTIVQCGILVAFPITQCNPVVVTIGELPHFQVFATTLLSGTMYTLSDPFSPSTQSPLSSPLCPEHNRCANYNEGKPFHAHQLLKNKVIALHFPTEVVIATHGTFDCISPPK